MKNQIAGGLFIVIGLLFLIWSQDYVFGRLGDIGPGFFPSVVSVIMIITGILISRSQK